MVNYNKKVLDLAFHALAELRDALLSVPQDSRELLDDIGNDIDKLENKLRKLKEKT